MRMPSLIAVVLIVAPWLNPFAAGPTPSTNPLLFAWACTALLLGMQGVLSGSRTAPDWLEVVPRALLVAALLSASIGVLQYFGATAVFGQWVNSTTPGNAFANLRQRNQFATLTNIGLAALAWSVARQLRPAAWQLAAAVLLATGNVVSSSRAGMVELVLLLAMGWVWGAWRRPDVRRVLLAAGLGYCAAALVLPALAAHGPAASGILGRLHDDAPACASRLILWANVLDLIAQRPWTGWGWGELDYAHFTTLYPGARFCDILDNAHNLPLHLAVELGLPFTLLLCGAGVAWVWRARPWREAQPERQMAWAVLAVIMLHSMVEYPLWYGPFQTAFGLCAWLLWSTRSHAARAGARGDAPGEQAAPPARSRSPGSGVAVVSCCVVLLGLAYAAWDYHRISQIYLPASERAPDYRVDTFEKVRGSWLFARQVRFAELTTVELTPANAEYVHAMAHDLLHFSPEPRVVEKLIESAVMLGRDDEVAAYRARYRAAFPAPYAQWVKSQQQP